MIFLTSQVIGPVNYDLFERYITIGNQVIHFSDIKSVWLRKTGILEHSGLRQKASNDEVKDQFIKIILSEVNLLKIIENNSFTKIWHITKDMVETCKDCEFRYICTDCRVFTKNNNLYSKPASCSYNPYEAVWEN